MRYIVTAEEMRALDAATIEDIGLPGAVLMETAGRAVASAILEEVGDDARRGPTSGRARVAVICGAGNNGGDGYVIARCLREAGLRATVYLLAPEDRVTGDARLHMDVYAQFGGVITSIADAESLARHRPAVEDADVLVDAIFGTGLTREVTGHYRAAIELINRIRGQGDSLVVAVDIPSGLAADTGAVLGAAVHADLTVTMAFLKVGLATAPGFAYAGDVRVAEIGIPRELAQARGVGAGWLEVGDLAPLLSPLSPLVHKNRLGHALVVAGSPGKRGAARLTAWAALRVGAGLVTLAGPTATGEITAPDPIMTQSLDPGASDALEQLSGAADGKAVVAIGPGMPTSDAGRALIRGALSQLEVPLVLDADGLNHIGTELERVADAPAAVVLTPHPGEAARLLGTTSAEVQRDRVAAVRELAAQTRAIVALKGARTLVCDGVAGDGFVTVNPSGNPGMATAGTGDVLTGVIAGLIAQGIAAAEATRLGVYLHGRAGDLAARDLGMRSVTAADLANSLPEAIVELESA